MCPRRRIMISTLHKTEGLGHSGFMFKHDVSEAEREQIVWSALRQGNRKALDHIFEKYIRLLYAYGNKISKDYGLIEDCIQDLFVELWNKRELLAESVHIKFYLMKSLRRRVVRRLMNESRLSTEQLQEHDYENNLEFSAEFHIIQEQSFQEQRQQLTEAIAQLSTRQREAVYLKFYEQLSYEEIAGIMNLTVKSAYKLIGKAIDSLRKTCHYIVRG
jgi:RNA polymerase sigma factor (sigma-70 family)